jgi:NADH-quinone oxidoreductase subunit J
MTPVDVVVLTAMVAASLWTVMTRSLLKSTIGLAFTSAIITIIMFRLNSPLAAVFELSVCTGLITAVFVSTISLMKPLTHKEIVKLSKDRAKRFWYLPVIIVIAGIALIFLNIPADLKMPAKAMESDVRNVLWNSRQIDIFGQIVVLLAGVFGIVLLFKEIKKK